MLDIALLIGAPVLGGMMRIAQEIIAQAPAEIIAKHHMERTRTMQDLGGPRVLFDDYVDMLLLERSIRYREELKRFDEELEQELRTHA